MGIKRDLNNDNNFAFVKISEEQNIFQKLKPIIKPGATGIANL
jgi:hypothetical protein